MSAAESTFSKRVSMLLQGRGKRGDTLKGEIVANLAAVPTLLVIFALALPWATQTVTGSEGCSQVAGLFTYGSEGSSEKCGSESQTYASSICARCDDNYTSEPCEGPICATLGPRKLAAGMSVTMLISLLITWYVLVCTGLRFARLIVCSHTNCSFVSFHGENCFTRIDGQVLWRAKAGVLFSTGVQTVPREACCVYPAPLLIKPTCASLQASLGGLLQVVCGGATCGAFCGSRATRAMALAGYA
jgi:hypothetical protein